MHLFFSPIPAGGFWIKTIHSLVILFGIVAGSAAQNNFRATLTPVVPTPENSFITGAAAFALNGTNVSFTISVGLENIVPTTAQLVGPQSVSTFDLGTPFIVVHSPGPWPNGYDGSTAFFGTFAVPAGMLNDLVAERTTLQLLGSRVGDFSGTVLSAPLPQLGSISRQGSSLQIRFAAEPPYRYTVEHAETVGTTNTIGLTNVSALSQKFEAVVTDSTSVTDARFYRIRRELCCQ